MFVHFVLFWFAFYFILFLDACLLSSKREKECGFGLGGGGDDLGGIEGREAEIRIYCMEIYLISVLFCYFNSSQSALLHGRGGDALLAEELLGADPCFRTAETVVFDIVVHDRLPAHLTRGQR